MIAWLHRDTNGYLDFEQIQTEEEYRFSASQTHNIGYQKNGKVDFKFAEVLAKGDELMGLGKNLTVSSTDQVQQQRGLYSPMTSFSNFYIFAQGINPADLASSPMALVHCLSQVDSPLSY